MRKVFTLIGILFFTVNLMAHEGELLTVRNVQVTALNDQVYFQFQIENVDEILLKNVEIELMAGRVSIATKSYDKFSTNRFTNEAFIVPSSKLEQLELSDISINVTRIFGVAMDWGGWHGLDPALANYNDVGDHEIFADAPWRMKIYDEEGAALPVPINILAHDGDQVWFSDKKQVIEYIDVYVKKSTETEFGDEVNFSDLSTEDFDELFEAKSPDRTDLDVQSFDLSLPQADADHTLAFRQSYKENGDYYYTRMTHGWWFFTLMLPTEELAGFADTDFLDIKVDFLLREDSGERYTRSTYLRVFRNALSLPTLPSFYRGDTHLHTYYSRSILEYGNPLTATKIAANAVGLDWIIVTDHTSDFDNWPYQNIADAYQRLGDEVNTLNAEDETLRYIRGQEVSLMNSQHQLVHFLAYPGYETPRDLPYLGDGGGDLQMTNVSAFNVLKRLSFVNGFAYSAHPFATADELPLIGGLWNVGDAEFPQDGELFVDGTPIDCNNINEPSDVFSLRSDEVIQNNLKGAQIWGVRHSLSGETVPHDPYNIRNEEGASMFGPSPDDETSYLNRYRQGEQVVNFVNKKGLEMKNQDPDLANFKLYYSAGTDAHGAYNYATTAGFGFGFQEEEVQVENTALGNINCVAYCPEGVGPEGEHALKAMYHGNFTISDGPLLVMGASTNGNDPVNEVLMGDDTEVNEADLTDVYINFEFVSTTEFGSIDFLRIFIGTENGEQSFLVSDLDDYGDDFSYTLEELADAAGMILPLDEYFYVRAELQTYAEYGANTPRILEGDNFHSFTNPVWFKVNRLVTGVNDELLKSFNMYPNPVDKVLHVEASVMIDAVTVYDTEGKIVLQQQMNSNDLNVSELPAGSYTLVAEAAKARITRNFVVY
ncbi:MAG: T9SS type A sorting domain-containing protein [Bacteroidetes bacterium]|nr:T9SS type A sorting domain-containing protein [Bacteroidota bacterium]